MKNICIIGSGSWGCALAIHAAKMGHNVKLWSFLQEEAYLLYYGYKRGGRRFRPYFTCYTI